MHWTRPATNPSTHQVEPRLRDVFDELRQHLQRALTLRKNHHVVADQVVGLQRVAEIRKHFQLGFGSLAVVQPEMVARLQVDGNGTVRVRLRPRRKERQDVNVCGLWVRFVESQTRVIPKALFTCR